MVLLFKELKGKSCFNTLLWDGSVPEFSWTCINHHEIPDTMALRPHMPMCIANERHLRKAIVWIIGFMKANAFIEKKNTGILKHRFLQILSKAKVSATHSNKINRYNPANNSNILSCTTHKLGSSPNSPNHGRVWKTFQGAIIRIYG